MSAKAGALAALKMARGISRQLLEGFPADRAAFQPAPTDNHLLWILGHMPVGYLYFASTLGGKITGVPEHYHQLFGTGSRPRPDAALYPPLHELRHAFDDAFNQFLALVEATPESDLTKPPLVGADWLPDRLAALHAVIWHEGWHGGQLANIRKALGLPNVMG